MASAEIKADGTGRRSSKFQDEPGFSRDFKSSKPSKVKGKFASVVENATRANQVEEQRYPKDIQPEKRRTSIALNSMRTLNNHEDAQDGVIAENRLPTWATTWQKTLHRLREHAAEMSSNQNEGPPTENDKAIQEALEKLKTEMMNKEEELIPTVNGMKTFGIAKNGISRAVVNYNNVTLRQHPLTLAFHFPQTFLNHSFVRHIINAQLTRIPGPSIVYIQYIDRNVIHGTRQMDNRWVVRLRTRAAYELLLLSGIEIMNRRIALRSYDSILRDEYNEYKEYVQMQKKYLYDKIRDLTGQVPKQAISLIKDVTHDFLADTDDEQYKPDAVINEDDENNSQTEE